MYKLAETLNAHSSDVRAVVSPLDTLVLSASRDCTAVSWTKGSSTPQFSPGGVYAASSRYVNSVAYIPPSSEAPKGYVITGGQDSIINVYALQSGRPDPLYTLLGHGENVCSLSTAKDGTIISGSWDRTARVWRNWQPLYELKGHSQSVWAVLPVEEELFLTGSADKSIKLWDHHKVIQTFTGHNDAVRGLALVPDVGFASCSNDSEIRVWTMGGDIVYTLTGHTSFVYSLSVLPNGDIVSGGEDRSVRIWRDGECAQTIIHPAISVWAVSTMPNGDIVSGCSDGVVRVFSALEDRWATAADLAAYEEQIASQALPSQQVGDVKKSDLPGSEALSIPGKKSGEVKMIRVNDKVEAHQWDSASSSWQKIGEVVDAVGSGRRQLYEGKEYDYVFDVDIQDGVPPLKLPYNANENPFTAAQRFLNANDLPMTYLDQVANFIQKNTAGVEMASGNEFVDPFTGASRYRSSTASVPMSSNQSNASSDPFTGGSRYTPSAPAPNAAPVAPPVQATVVTFTPATDLSLYTSADAERIKRKIMEVYNILKDEVMDVQVKLHPEDFRSMNYMCQYITQVRNSQRVEDHPTFDDLVCILRFLETFPVSERLPLLDLMKLVARCCPHSYSKPENARRLSQALLAAVQWSDSWDVPLSSSRSSAVQLCLKGLANMMGVYASPRDLSWVPQLFDQLRAVPYAGLEPAHRVALGTIAYNLSALCVRSEITPPQPVFDAQLRLVLHILTQIPEDGEAKQGQRDGVFRALHALGNSLYLARAATNGPIGGSISVTIRGALNSAVSAYGNDEGIKNVSKDILTLL